MVRKDWLLIALAMSGESGLSPLQAQKTMFLLGQERREYLGNDFYHFVPYDYGPFDASVYQDTSHLISEGHVYALPSATGRYMISKATALGSHRAAAMEQGAAVEAVDHLRSIVDWVTRQTFKGLLSAVYDRYPDFAVNSVFRTRAS